MLYSVSENFMGSVDILAQNNKSSTTKKAGTSNKAKSSGASRSNTSKKSPQNSKKKTTGKKQNQQITLENIIRRREITGTLLFVLGMFFTIIAFGAGKEGSAWNNLHMFYFAVFGISGFCIPVLFIISAVLKILAIDKKSHIKKLFEIYCLFAVICAFLHIRNISALQPDLSFADAISESYDSILYGDIAYRISGGFIGAVIGGGFFAICGSVAISNVFCSILLLTDIMFLFGITLFKVFSGAREPVKKVGEKTAKAVENVKSDIERRRTESAQLEELERECSGIELTRVVDNYYNSREKEKQKRSEKYNSDTDDFEKRNTKKKDKSSVFDMIFNVEDDETDSSSTASSENTDNIGVNEEQTDEVKKEPKTAEDEPDIFSKAAFNATERDKSNIEKITGSESRDEISSIFDIPQQSDEAKEKTEKVEPLSDKESEMISRELDDALAAAPEKPVYHFPPLDCLKMPEPVKKGYAADELRANGEKLIESLNSFNVKAEIVDVVPGPTVTRYELSPSPGVKISKFTSLSDDLALHMAAPAGLRIVAPIPNKAAIGIEIPNRNKTTVTFREVIDTPEYKNAKSKLTVALGKNISGDPVYCDLAKMPHLLVAGTTGSGKSICLHSMIISILYNASPDEVKLLLIDPKQVEFGDYNGIPHLLVPVVSDPRKASGALGWAVTEMLSRYKTLNANGVRDIGSYNNLCEMTGDMPKMPQIVIVIDELADLMSAAPAEVEDSIQRLAQMARAAGMHLVIATQRPSTDVITGIIKANIPSRIALMVKQQIDSRIIIDEGGAEKLMGHGDMLYYPVGFPKPERLQGAFITDDERKNIVNYIKSNGTATYDDSVQQEIERQAAADSKKKGGSDSGSTGGVNKNDDLMMSAIELFVNTPEKASISALQRHLGLGFAKAGRLMDTLEENGIVGPAEGSKPRKVLLTKQQWYEMNAMSSEVTDTPLGENNDSDEQ